MAARAVALPWSGAARAAADCRRVQMSRLLLGSCAGLTCTPAQTAQLLQPEIQRWGVVIEKARIPKQ